MNEKEWDKKLNIDSIGRNADKEDKYHYPYEPTPYSVLERLTASDYLNKNSIIIDYGCGKGRVGFFLNYKLGCKVIGIDFDERMCGFAQRNLLKYGTNKEIDFVGIGAEQYEIEDADNFYFFNPFSVEILKPVIGKIRKSYYSSPRNMRLFFYYPSNEYISYLMTVQELCFLGEIDCRDLFDSENERERIIVFEMMYQDCEVDV